MGHHPRVTSRSSNADSEILQVCQQPGEVAGGPVGGADCYSGVNWSATVVVGNPTLATFVPEQNVMRPGLIPAFPGTGATFPATQSPLYSNF